MAGERNGQAAGLRHSGRPGQAPTELSVIYPSAVSWEVKKEALLDQRGLTPSWGMGIIIGLLLPLAMEPIRHFSSPDSPTTVACSWEDEAMLGFSSPEQEQPQTGRAACAYSDLYLIPLPSNRLSGTLGTRRIHPLSTEVSVVLSN